MAFFARTEEIQAVVGADDYGLTYPYLDRSHVFVFTRINAEASAQLYTGVVTFLDDNTVNLNPNPVGEFVQVRRITPKDDLLERLTGPAPIDADELNLIATQLLYIAQENCDSLDASGLIDLAALLADLRGTYEVSLGAATWTDQERAGPVVIGRGAILRANLPGTRYQTYLPPPLAAGDTVISIRKNNVEIGTLTVQEVTGAVTASFPVDVGFVLGDDLSLVTTTETGLQDFGVTFQLERI